ncbi:hypothetical protein [Paenibacillus sp. HJGM_3]|uniref:hypothetical protein n=1 Tax=Paenibacillus sp. HJGM_3 TaxID=3379816 RepID=UPI003858EF8E
MVTVQISVVGSEVRYDIISGIESLENGGFPISVTTTRDKLRQWEEASGAGAFRKAAEDVWTRNGSIQAQFRYVDAAGQEL